MLSNQGADGRDPELPISQRAGWIAYSNLENSTSGRFMHSAIVHQERFCEEHVEVSKIQIE